MQRAMIEMLEFVLVVMVLVNVAGLAEPVKTVWIFLVLTSLMRVRRLVESGLVRAAFDGTIALVTLKLQVLVRQFRVLRLATRICWLVGMDLRALWIFTLVVWTLRVIRILYLVVRGLMAVVSLSLMTLVVRVTCLTLN